MIETLSTRPDQRATGRTTKMLLRLLLFSVERHRAYALCVALHKDGALELRKRFVAMAEAAGLDVRCGRHGMSCTIVQTGTLIDFRWPESDTRGVSYDVRMDDEA